MNPNDVQPSGQPPRWPNQPTNEPRQSNRYAWQQHLGEQDPDAQIIPNPGNVAQQPFEQWPGTAQPEPPSKPLPQLPPQPQPQPQPQPPLQPLPEPQPVPPQPVMPPEPPMQPPVRKRGKKKWVFLLILLLLAAGAVYWFALKPSDTKTKKQSDTAATTNTNKPSTISDAARESSAAVQDTATELATLQSVKLNAPSSMSDYDVLTQSETFARYLSKTHPKCELGFGTLTAEDLPGTDLDSIIATQIKNLRDSGATVSDPAAGTALVLNDSTDSSKKYSIPTLKFELSKDDLRVTSRYSAVVLKDGRRAVVNRTCYTEDGTAVGEAGIEALDATAKQVTVTAG